MIQFKEIPVQPFGLYFFIYCHGNHKTLRKKQLMNKVNRPCASFFFFLQKHHYFKVRDSKIYRNNLFFNQSICILLSGYFLGLRETLDANIQAITNSRISVSSTAFWESLRRPQFHGTRNKKETKFCLSIFWEMLYMQPPYVFRFFKHRPQNISRITILYMF